MPSFKRWLHSGSTSDTAYSGLWELSRLPRKHRDLTGDRAKPSTWTVRECKAGCWWAVFNHPMSNPGWHVSERHCLILKDHISIYMLICSSLCNCWHYTPWFSVQIKAGGKLLLKVSGISAEKEAKFFRVNLDLCLNSALSADAPKKCSLFKRHKVLWRPEIAPVR